MNLEFSITNLDEVRRAFDPDVVQKAMRTTVRRSMMRIRTEASKEIRKDYHVKAGDVSKAVKLTTRFRSEETVAFLTYRSEQLPLNRFAARFPTINGRTGVSIKVKRANKRVRLLAAFPFELPDGSRGVFQRLGEERANPRYAGDEKIGRMRGISIAQMLNRAVVDRVNQKLEPIANIELNRNLRFFQDRARR